jgi:signal transduction histidine kinase
VSITYSQRFLELQLPDVNAPIILGAVANMVSNSIYWTTRGPGTRKIHFSIVPHGFVVSDSGPGVRRRDWSQIFEPFFGRRPYGRGLGLYIAKTNLEACNMELSLSDETEKGALAGANFVIRKREG